MMMRKTAMHFEDAAYLTALVPMKPSAAHVLWQLIARLDSVNWSIIGHQDMADVANLDRVTVTRALSELAQRGIIMRAAGGRMRLSLFLVFKGSDDDYREQVKQRGQEVVEAVDWHTSRAIANIDSEHCKGLVEWAHDPGRAEQAAMDLLPRPATDNLPARPDGIGLEDWHRLATRFPNAPDGVWAAILATLHNRSIDEEIDDWIDDFAVKYWGQWNDIEYARQQGWYRLRGEEVDFSGYADAG